MSKKKRQDKQDRQTPGQPQKGPPPTEPGVPAGPDPEPVDPRYLTWTWYGKIFAGCMIFSSILFFAFVTIMKTISKNYTEDGIAMYEMAKSLQAHQKDRDVDTIASELAALDAVVDIEMLKGFLLSDVAYRSSVSEDTKAWLMDQDEKYTRLVEHLKTVAVYDDVQDKIRDKTVDKIGVIQECIREIIKSLDMKDREQLKQKVIRLDKKIAKAGWYSQIAAGFFSWPAALDAAERSFFEALRFWQQNQEAAYWWGRTLDETAIHDVAAEKKIMAIKFDPKSALSDSILAEIKAEFVATPDAPRKKYNYAFALYRKGRTDEALPLLRQVYEQDRQMNTFESFLAKRRLDIIERKIDMRWYKTDDF